PRAALPRTGLPWTGVLRAGRGRFGPDQSASRLVRHSRPLPIIFPVIGSNDQNPFIALPPVLVGGHA
ncbi:hypothetical protein, partial [Actinomadura soli]|uniref:hypothetical protein n=1 Tax=Actinomadura soli TaxID=2508997 RepID=UPI00197AC47A